MRYLSLVLLTALSLPAQHSASAATKRAKASCAAFLENETAQAYLRVTQHLLDSGELSLEELKWLSQSTQAVAPRRLNGEAHETDAAKEAYNALVLELKNQPKAWGEIKKTLSTRLTEALARQKDVHQAKEETEAQVNLVEYKAVSFLGEGHFKSLLTQSGQLLVVQTNQLAKTLSASLGARPIVTTKVNEYDGSAVKLLETSDGRYFILIFVLKRDNTITSLFEFKNNQLIKMGERKLPIDIDLDHSTLIEEGPGQISLAARYKNAEMMFFNLLNENSKSVNPSKSIKTPPGNWEVPTYFITSDGQKIIYIDFDDDDQEVGPGTLIDVESRKKLKVVQIPQTAFRRSILLSQFLQNSRNDYLGFSIELDSDYNNLWSYFLVDLREPTKVASEIIVDVSDESLPEILPMGKDQHYLLKLQLDKIELRKFDDPKYFKEWAFDSEKILGGFLDSILFFSFSYGGSDYIGFMSPIEGTISLLNVSGNGPWLHQQIDLPEKEEISRVVFTHDHQGQPALAFIPRLGKQYFYFPFKRLK